jgi:hypothetical protein
MFYCDSNHQHDLIQLLFRYQLEVKWIEIENDIPGSFWGDSEAGLIGNTLYVRSDTPIHSALHEACHYVCMDKARRAELHTDAAGDFAEESAVCLLQILLADQLPRISTDDMMMDMDRWGYSFRLGSAKKWFDNDAEDARAWLVQYDLIDKQGLPTWNLRN